ncbi:MAG: DNA cytosine methyltransferase [Prosthecobacter sp.]|uniref:DNA cytosine methyltransferase n=1 Tax=Prosthecobacter sp. TaxID=1965333 RepID=UPI003BAF8BCE
MPTPQLILDLHTELIIDNFAGGGGASTGIERALGRHVDHAINHDAAALGMHRINHAQTVHHCEDVFEVDPVALTEGRPVGMAWFSPDCRHFSKAKGGKPVEKKIRGLCLVMLRYAKIRSRVMFMENVEEIQTWGPLVQMCKKGDIGWYPDPQHKGRTWRAFLDCLGTGIAADHPDLPEILEVLGGTVTAAECIRGFGYKCEHRELRACDYGAPTIRKRLFMIARRDGKPIVWPAATHADPKKALPGSKLKPWRTIAECIDWNLACPSIFLTGAAAKAARCKRPLADPTLRRIAKGIDRYVLKSARPFLVSLTHQGGERVESVDAPANTITGANRGEKAVVMTKFHGSHKDRDDGSTRGQSLTDPLLSADTSNRFSLAAAELAPFITEHANASTQCAQVQGGHFAVVTGTVVNSANGKTTGRGPNTWNTEEPLRTVTSSASFNLAAATLVHTAHGEQDKAGNPRRGRGAHDLQESMPSICGSPDMAVAAASMVKLRGTSTAADVAEPLHTASAGGNHHALVAVTAIRHFGQSIGQPVDEPAPTVVAGGMGKTGLLAAVMAQNNGGFNTTPAHPVDEPVSTLSSTGSQQTLITASCAAYYGTEEDGQPVDDPARTITAKARQCLVEHSSVNYLTPDQLAGALRVAAFLRAHGVQLEGDFATVGGYVMVDIGMRMLTPRELFRAQGFPEDYVIDKAWHIDPKTGTLTEQPLTKAEQIKKCGNSVCPPVAEAIVKANVPELRITPPAPPKPRNRRNYALIS